MSDDGSPDKAVTKPAARISEVLPKSGLVYSEKSNLTELHCKPKIMPIKSAALERLEQMETAAKALMAAQTPQSRSGVPQSRSGAPGGRPTSARPTSAAGRLRSAAGQRPQ